MSTWIGDDMKKLLFSIMILVLLMCGSAFGDTYYVKTGGSNTAPYDTWAKASTLIATINALSLGTDDTVNLRPGDTFDDATLTLDSTSSTTSGITVQGLDGDGKSIAVDGKPIIDGNSVHPIIINHALVNLTLKNIDISGSDYDGGSVRARAHLEHINGLVIDGIDYNGHTGSSTYYRANGITVARVLGDIEIKNCTIQNLYKDTYANTITAWDELDAHAILFWYPEDDGVKTSGTVSIHDNTLQLMYSDGIQLAGVRTTTNIYDNTIDRFGENAIDLKPCDSINIYNNTFSHNDFGVQPSGYRGPTMIAHTPSGAEGDWPSYRNSNITIRDNLFSDCVYAGIGGGATNLLIYRNYFSDVFNPLNIYAYESGMEIYNNILECTGAKTDVEPYASRWAGTRLTCIRLSTNSALDNLKVYNNTIYCSGSDHLYGIVYLGNASATGNEIKNNCVYMTQNSASVYPFYYDGVAIAPTTLNNSFYNSGHTNRVNWVGDEVYDSTEQAGYRTNHDAGALFADPGLNDVGSSEFWAATGSSIIVDAGDDLGAAFDDGWHPDSSMPPTTVTTVLQDDHGTGWDIGAYVYIAPEDDPPVGENDFANDANCIGHYLLDDIANSSSSGATDNLTNAGTTIFSGGGAVLNGTDQYLYKNTDTGLSGTIVADFTVYASFTFADELTGGGWNIIASEWDTTDSQYVWLLGMNNDEPSDVVKFYIGHTGGAGAVGCIGDFDLDHNVRHYVVAQFDADAGDADGTAWIYMYNAAGTLLDTTTCTSFMGGETQNVEAVEFCTGCEMDADAPNAATLFKGTIYEVAVTKDILDATERVDTVKGEYSNPQGTFSGLTASAITAAGTHRITLTSDREIYVTDGGSGLPSFPVTLDYPDETRTYTYAGKSSTDSYWDCPDIVAGDRLAANWADGDVGDDITVPSGSTMVDIQDNAMEATSALDGKTYPTTAIAIPSIFTVTSVNTPGTYDHWVPGDDLTFITTTDEAIDTAVSGTAALPITLHIKTPRMTALTDNWTIDEDYWNIEGHRRTYNGTMTDTGSGNTVTGFSAASTGTGPAGFNTWMPHLLFLED